MARPMAERRMRVMSPASGQAGPMRPSAVVPRSRRVPAGYMRRSRTIPASTSTGREEAGSAPVALASAWRSASHWSSATHGGVRRCQKRRADTAATPSPISMNTANIAPMKTIPALKGVWADRAGRAAMMRAPSIPAPMQQNTSPKQVATTALVAPGVIAWVIRYPRGWKDERARSTASWITWALPPGAITVNRSGMRDRAPVPPSPDSKRRVTLVVSWPYLSLSVWVWTSATRAGTRWVTETMTPWGVVWSSTVMVGRRQAGSGFPTALGGGCSGALIVSCFSWQGTGPPRA